MEVVSASQIVINAPRHVSSPLTTFVAMPQVIHKETQNVSASDASFEEVEHDSNEVRTLLQTMDEQAYDSINSTQLIRKLKSEGFQCQYCQKVLSSKYSLKMHTRLHTGEKPLKCKECDACFSHPTDLRRHNQKHTGLKPYTCDVCGAKFTQSGSLRGHSKLHQGEKPHKCTKCNESFVSLGLLKTHVRIHGNESKYFRCTNCEKTFEHAKEVIEHCKLFHATPVVVESEEVDRNQQQVEACEQQLPSSSKEEKLSATFVDMSSILVRNKSNKKKCLCKVCGRILSSSYALKLHNNHIHGGVRPYHCEFCPYTTAYSSHLKRHRAKHTDEKLFKCEICEKSFAYGHALKQHQDTHEENRKQTCRLCSEEFKNQSMLLKHWISKHRSADRPFFCLHCFDTFVDRESLQQHKDKVHAVLTDENTCLQCGMVFTRACNLKRHMVHSCHGKDLTCDECQQTFCGRAGLLYHMQAVHDVNGLFQCDVCKRRFKERYKLKHHVMVKHKNKKEEAGGCDEKENRQEHERKYEHSCNICQRNFSTKYNLTRHLRTRHAETKRNIKYPSLLGARRISTEKSQLNCRRKEIQFENLPLNCSHCKKCFRCYFDLQKHKHFFHRRKCMVCGAIFRTRSFFYMHRNLAHKRVAKLFECALCNKTFYAENVQKYHMKLHKQRSTAVVDSQLKIRSVDKIIRTKQHVKKNRDETSYLGSTKRRTKHHENPPTCFEKYACDICGDEFNDSCKLSFHTRMHFHINELTPHKCQHCACTFVNFLNMRRHTMQSHHHSVRRFWCNVCNHGYSKKTRLTKHMKLHPEIVRLKCASNKQPVTLAKDSKPFVESKKILIKNKNCSQQQQQRQQPDKLEATHMNTNSLVLPFDELIEISVLHD